MHRLSGGPSHYPVRHNKSAYTGRSQYNIISGGRKPIFLCTNISLGRTARLSPGSCRLRPLSAQNQRSSPEKEQSCPLRPRRKHTLICGRTYHQPVISRHFHLTVQTQTYTETMFPGCHPSTGSTTAPCRRPGK